MLQSKKEVHGLKNITDAPPFTKEGVGYLLKIGEFFKWIWILLNKDMIVYLFWQSKASLPFDLKHVHRLSSMGIGAIMRCMMTIRTEGGDLRLTGLSDKVKNILSITHLVGVIKSYDSIKEAIVSFDEE